MRRSSGLTFLGIDLLLLLSVLARSGSNDTYPRKDEVFMNKPFFSVQ
jgi:hypothetical protein